MTQTFTFEEIMRNRDIWTEALKRDGDDALPQTAGHLRDDKGYCCLGVAPLVCDLDAVPYDGQGPNGFEFTYDYVDDIDGLVPHYKDHRSSDLPEISLNKLGLTQQTQTFLITLNDDAQLSFPQIANVIDNLPVYNASDYNPADEWDEFKFIQFKTYLFTEANRSWYESKLRTALQRVEVLQDRISALEKSLAAARS